MEFLIAPFIAIWAMITIPVHHAAWRADLERHHGRSVDYPAMHGEAVGKR